MNSATQKNYKSYNFISRYTAFPYYYQILDSKWFYGLTGQLNKSVAYVEHTTSQTDTLDSLSLYYYGRPDLYWVIADYNDIRDPFIRLKKDKKIKIPALGNISFED